MGNPELISQIPQHTTHVYHAYHPVVHHTVHHVVNHPVVKQTIYKEISVLHDIINITLAVIVSLPAGFGLGWYVKGRGVTGVKTDITNAENTVKAV